MHFTVHHRTRSWVKVRSSSWMSCKHVTSSCKFGDAPTASSKESNVLLRDKLYFDGSLPTAKEPIRVARLESYLKQLITYKSTHLGPFRVPEISSRPGPVGALKLFHDVNPVPTHLSTLPAPPFLVPAVIEALMHSQYGNVTQVVPGEADEFCAARARNFGGVVFSSDSDLLVADLGSDGSVSLFRDICLDTNDGSKTVKTSIFKSKGIAAKLGLPDLLGLAFELTKDSTISFHEGVRRAKLLMQTMAENVSYQDFIRCYRIAIAPGSDSNPYNGKEAELQSVDPRVSELLLQYQKPALEREAGVTTNDLTFQPKIYLPFLLDDPARSSAWVVSTSLRTIAYSVLNLSTNDIIKPANIAEYGRSGNRITPKSLKLLARHELSRHCTALTGRLKKARTSFRSPASSIFWPLYGLYELCRWYQENDKPLPCQDVLVKVLKAGRQGGLSVSWEYIHLSMQLQGVLYSIRILRQIIAQLRIMRGARDLLYDQLRDLPPLKELFPARYQLSKEQEEDRHWDHTINAVFDLIADELTEHGRALRDNQTPDITQKSDVEPAILEACSRHQEHQPRNKRRKGTVSGFSDERNTPNHLNNMYTVLNRG